MTALLDAVRRRLDPNTLVKKGLKRSGCSLSLSGAPKRRLIVDFDKDGSPLNQNQTRCDYLFIAESDEKFAWVVPLELKKGCLDTSKVVKQLKAGTSVAEKLVPSIESVRFLPIAVVGRVHKAERKKLRTNSSKIQFHGCTEAIRLMECGGQLMNVL